MSDQVIVMTPKCPRCGDVGEIVMSAEDADHGATLRWAKLSPSVCFPNLSDADRTQLWTGLHPQCWALMVG